MAWLPPTQRKGLHLTSAGVYDHRQSSVAIAHKDGNFANNRADNVMAVLKGQLRKAKRHLRYRQQQQEHSDGGGGTAASDQLALQDREI